MKMKDDLNLNLIVSGIGHFSHLGYEAAQKYTEFLHLLSTFENLRSIRHRLINSLYREETYLLVLVPYRDQTIGQPETVQSHIQSGEIFEKNDSQISEYEACFDYLFSDPNSIDRLLKIGLDDPVQLRLVSMTFNDPDAQIESQCQNLSRYKNDSVIHLEHHDEATDDLTMMLAFQLYTYGILEALWEYDDKVKTEVYRRT
jgi:hypothetical protein